MRRTARLALALTIALTPMLAGCKTNEATGKTYINALSREEEIAMGEAAMPEMVQGYGGAVTDPALNQYVTSIGLEMAAYTEGDFPTLPWEFTILNSDVINAFALPGGKVFISRGLAEKMNNEAQLAGVLGHEIGHVTAQHIDQRVGRQFGLAIGATIASVFAGQSDSDWAQAAAGVAVTGAGVYALSFDRGEETESDTLGMRYMAKAGYNPAGQLQVMQILQAAAGDAGGQPEFLSTHPLPQTRIDHIKKLLKTEYAYTQNDPAYGLYAERFQTQFLSRIKSLPPAPETQTGLLPFVPCPVCGGTHIADAGQPTPEELASMRRLFQ